MLGMDGDPCSCAVKVCIVLATIKRVSEVERFLESLSKQTYRNFCLIVVDQNDDDRLRDVLGRFMLEHDLLWLRSDPGLSRARNAGLMYAVGDVVAFPDDDCSYPPELLASVAELFANSPVLDGVSGALVDINGGARLWNMYASPVRVTLDNVWRCVVSVTIFLRKSTVDSVGLFDPKLGAGAGTPWAAGEETDYVCRCLIKGSRIEYVPDIKVRHPNPVVTYDIQTCRRAYGYGRGMGKVLGSYDFSVGITLRMFLRPIIAAGVWALLLRIGRAKYHWAALRGRVRGWCDARALRDGDSC